MGFLIALCDEFFFGFRVMENVVIYLVLYIREGVVLGFDLKIYVVDYFVFLVFVFRGFEEVGKKE